MKTCPKCKRALPYSEFNKAARTKDGLQAWCRACGHAYAATPHQLSKRSEYARTIKGQFSAAKANAKLREIPWDLSLADFIAIRKQTCHWPGCGGTLPDTGSGLDRIDNQKGYTVGNVVACCEFHNKDRMNLSHEEYHFVLAVRHGKEALKCDLLDVSTWRHFPTLI